MPHPAQIAPAVASSSSSSRSTTAPTGAGLASSSARPPVARPTRLKSSGSFHAGAPIPSFPGPYDTSGLGRTRRKDLRADYGGMRRQSTYRYTTFPTQPPKTPNADPDSAANGLSRNPYSGTLSDDDRRRRRRGQRSRHRHTNSRDSHHDTTPLPIRQLALLALLSICEQTALNSIGPYLPTMVSSFPEIPDGEAGLYVGLLASSFACAQLVTNFLWGYVSDRVGRKPVMLLGTAFLSICFAFFGFCEHYWQVLIVHVAMGLLNGNAAVVPTVLGEVTDRSNQSKAFTWLPVMYSLGGITGPALGGLLVGKGTHPFLGPNLMSAVVLAFAVVVLAIWFEETLEDVDRIPGLAWAEKLCSCFGRAKGKRGWANPNPNTNSVENGDGYDGGTGEDQSLLHGPAPAREDTKDVDADADADDTHHHHPRRSTLRQLLNWTTISILLTYLIFQVANISFNSLYPIFASAPPPTGRSLGPGTIGVSMSLAGVVTIFFQVSLFERVKARLGNLGTFRLSLLGLAVCMCLIPWVGYPDSASGRVWLLGEFGVILVLKNLSAVGGLSCVLLLVSLCLPHPLPFPPLAFTMTYPRQRNGILSTDLSLHHRSQTQHPPTNPSAPSTASPRPCPPRAEPSAPLPRAPCSRCRRTSGPRASSWPGACSVASRSSAGCGPWSSMGGSWKVRISSATTTTMRRWRWRWRRDGTQKAITMVVIVRFDRCAPVWGRARVLFLSQASAHVNFVNTCMNSVVSLSSCERYLQRSIRRQRDLRLIVEHSRAYHVYVLEIGLEWVIF